MAKTSNNATMACTGLTAGALAGGVLLMGDDPTLANGYLTDDIQHEDSVTLAVALPQAGSATAPAVDLVPSLRKTPPVPSRAPSVAPINLAGDAKTESFAERLAKAVRIEVAEPAAVRARPSDDAAMLYGFPAGRKLLEIDREGDFVRVADIESGATGWVEQTALASSLLSASVTEKPAPAKRVNKPIKQASAEIDTPKPVTGIPKKTYRPMMLGGSSKKRTRSCGNKTNFAGFLKRALR